MLSETKKKLLQSVHLINHLPFPQRIFMLVLLLLLFSLSVVLTFQSVKINKRHFLFIKRLIGGGLGPQ